MIVVMRSPVCTRWKRGRFGGARRHRARAPQSLAEQILADHAGQHRCDERHDRQREAGEIDQRGAGADAGEAPADAEQDCAANQRRIDVVAVRPDKAKKPITTFVTLPFMLKRMTKTSPTKVIITCIK